MMHPLRAASSSLAPKLDAAPALVAALVAALVLAGCAEAPPPMTSAGAAAQPPPSLFGPSGSGTSPVDDEMVAIGKSEVEIDRLLPGPSKEQARKGAPPPDAQRADKGSAREGPAAPQSDGDPCATACRALASMQRSAAHLCALAGEGDGRCEDARGRVRGASARVRTACPSCAAPP